MFSSDNNHKKYPTDTQDFLKLLIVKFNFESSEHAYT